MKPGLAELDHMPPPLPMQSGCMRCHMSGVQASDEGTINRYRGLPFLHAGITCEACHGPGGNKPVSPETPRLAAQEYDYLVQALTQYRKGSRENPIMGAMAKSLDDAQIRELSRYFSDQRGLTEKY